MRVAVGLGSNIGDRRSTLEMVLRKLDVHPGLSVIRTSRWYRTPPMRGGTAHGWFLNGVTLLQCHSSLDSLLALCISLEARAGRRPARFWGDRPLDLDLLLAEGAVRDDPALTLPHPGIPHRPFVLVPLLEVWPDARDPRTGRLWVDSPPAPGPRPVAVGVTVRRLPLASVGDVDR
jgi:2-amino-4-hydroxy-6-hydroxymethyldihydropteridine diphosphokinase